MTGVVTVVDVQWALYGKAAGASGDRVIACSAGDLAMVNFADAISRFQLGALHTLPQVSVSYAQQVKSGGAAREYLTFLEDTFVEPMARLTRLTEAYGFGDGSVRNAVSLVTQPATAPPPPPGPQP